MNSQRGSASQGTSLKASDGFTHEAKEAASDDWLGTLGSLKESDGSEWDPLEVAKEADS